MKSKALTGGVIDVEARVRSNATRAGLIAGVLILVGFFVLTGAIPGSHSLLLYTVRLGGLAMVCIAVWSSIGHPLALLADAVACCVIGLLLLLCAILFTKADGVTLNGVLCVVCGVLFVSSFVRGVREYRALPPGDDADESAEPAEVGEPTEGSPPAPSVRTAGRRSVRKAAREHQRSEAQTPRPSKGYFARLTRKDRTPKA